MGLELNPYKGLLVKPDGTSFRIAHAPYFKLLDWTITQDEWMASILKRADAEYISFDSGGDPQLQVAWVEDLMTVIKPDALALAVNDEVMLAPVLDQASASGIPVFIIDLLAQTENPTAWIIEGSGKGIDVSADFSPVFADWAGEPVAGADVLGQYYVDIAEQTNQEIKIYEVWGTRDLQLGQQRHKAFRKPLDGHPLIEVVESPDSGWTDEGASNLVMDWFTANPEFNACWVMGGGSTGAIDALRAIGRLLPKDDPGHVILTTHDQDTRVVEAIDAGELDACTTHSPYQLLDVGTKVMFQHLVLGQPIEKWYEIPMKAITADNIDTPDGWVFGAPAYPRMAPGQWDLWPILDTEEFLGFPTPTVELRKQYQGY
ncbi:sugar ABC transporter substrate-binding protein [Chloroflexota bacterium]